MRWTRNEVVEEDQCKVMTEVSNASEVRELGTKWKRDISDSTTMQVLHHNRVTVQLAVVVHPSGKDCWICFRYDECPAACRS